MTDRGRSAVAVALLLGLAAMVAGGADAAAPKKGRARGPVRPPGDTSAVMAVIDGEALTRAMVEARLAEIPEQFRSSYTTPQGRQQLIDRLIEERVWLKTAEKSDVGSRAEVRDQLERQRRDLLVRTYLNERLAQAPPVADSVAQAYYDAHIEEYRTPATVTLQHILLKDERAARRAKGLAEKGDWAKLVTQHSLDSLTKSTAGALGTVTLAGNFASIGTQPALAESAFALGEGRVGGPFQTERGWHVIKVGATVPEGLRSFDQMKAVIVRQLGSEQQQGYYRDLLDQARRDLGVTADSAAIRGYVSQRKPAREMFQEAQNIGPAEQRIQAYRQVVEEYPDADVSPQALFMVGFIHSEELKRYDEAEKVFQELLQRYPRSELTESARWMLEHMTSDEAPPFLELGADSTGAAADPEGSRAP
jgi:parvulin-like peptidyl-prolyl isomerase